MAQEAIITHQGQVIDAENPLLFGPLNADEDAVSDWKVVNVKMPTGLVGTLVLDVVGTSDAKFQLASDVEAPVAYGEALPLADVDDTVGVDINVRAKAESGEAAAEDVSCSLVVTGSAISE